MELFSFLNPLMGDSFFFFLQEMLVTRKVNTGTERLERRNLSLFVQMTLQVVLLWSFLMMPKKESQVILSTLEIIIIFFSKSNFCNDTIEMQARQKLRLINHTYTRMI